MRGAAEYADNGAEYADSGAEYADNGAEYADNGAEYADNGAPVVTRYEGSATVWPAPPLVRWVMAGMRGSMLSRFNGLSLPQLVEVSKLTSANLHAAIAKVYKEHRRWAGLKRQRNGVHVKLPKWSLFRVIDARSSTWRLIRLLVVVVVNQSTPIVWHFCTFGSVLNATSGGPGAERGRHHHRCSGHHRRRCRIGCHHMTTSRQPWTVSTSAPSTATGRPCGP